MSNIKAVYIHAELPYDAPEKPEWDELAKRIGWIVLRPILGIEVIVKEKEPFGQWMVERLGDRKQMLEDKHDGSTILIITGREAVSASALESLVDAIVATGGALITAWYQDLEDLPSMPMSLDPSKRR